MKKLKLFLVVTMVFFVILTGCSNFGTEKEFNGVQLFYTSSITEAEANSLGNYLIKSEFADGNEKTVQINKTGNTYEFRMVVKEGVDKDEENIELAKIIAAQFSADVFNGSPVEVHYCDNKLNTLKVIPMESN